MKPPKKIYLPDTNVIIRFLLGDHKGFSPKAESFMVEVSAGRKQAEILDVVVVECIYVLEKYYQVPRTEIADQLSRIISLPGFVNADKSEILSALLKYKESDVDIVDCILAARSSETRVIVSFDEDFKKLKAVREPL